MRLPYALRCFFTKAFVVIGILTTSIYAQTKPPSVDRSAGEPVRYVGEEEVDKHFFHGGLRQAIGVHRRQVFRANRSNPPEGGKIGWTYSHAPMLAYWNGTFYLQYLSCFKEEHDPPSRTMLITSRDGQNWSIPKIVFPIYYLPEIRYQAYYVPEGMESVMHQRMGFYVAPNGRLLTIAFYSYCPTPRIGPNKGQGLGRVVREIYHDGSFGPIYFIRYNRHAGWNESNTKYPFYKESKDAGFVQACEDLLSDKLATLQWWEMDQARDGFYTIDPGEVEIKALSYYHRSDGVVVGLWKYQWSALSHDDGKTWTDLVQSKSLMTCGAKVWGQRTDDGKYALVYNHSATRRNRFPMVIMTSEDGHIFNDMLCLHGEVSPMRYQGIHKNIGTQYIRGISEGNGNPPGNYMWNTYSMNKEDIWVSRTHVPVHGIVKKHVEEDFKDLKQVSELELWNLHIPQWAPIRIENDPFDPKNRCLQLRDEDPYEYAMADVAFPERQKVTIHFHINPYQIGHALLEVEVHNKQNRRALRLRFDPHWLSMDVMKTELAPIPVTTGEWYDILLNLDCDEKEYELILNGQLKAKGVEFAQDMDTVERLVFRTGSWRADVRQYVLDGSPGNPGLYMEDLPGADDKVPESIFYIDDLRTADYP